MTTRNHDLDCARARIARAVQQHDHAEAEQARRDYAALKIERAITEAVAGAPPLSSEQRARLAGLLGGAS